MAAGLVWGRAAAASPEQELWQQIVALSAPAAAENPYPAWLAREQDRRRALLARVRLYQTLYPGAEHRDDAVRMELQALFELAVCSGTGLESVCERAAEIRRGAPSPAAVHEAAYWELVCQGRRSAPPDPCGLNPEYLRAVRVYVSEYPASRYAPRLAAVLFDAASREDGCEPLGALVAGLRAHHAGDPLLATLAARLRRLQAVGQPFWPSLRLTSGATVAREEFRGRRVILLVWAGFDPAAREFAARVAASEDARELAVISIHLDESAAQAEAAASTAGLGCNVVCDGLGWGGEFVRAWGVERIPFFFELDADGRLVRTGGADNWAGPPTAAATSPSAR